MSVDSTLSSTRTPTSMLDLAGQIHGLQRTRTFDDVIADLLEIERARDGYANPARSKLRRRIRRAPDGVACFNFMYLRVTQAVNGRLPQFEKPAFLEPLRG